jgi:hypothetical protein
VIREHFGARRGLGIEDPASRSSVATTEVFR